MFARNGVLKEISSLLERVITLERSDTLIPITVNDYVFADRRNNPRFLHFVAGNSSKQTSLDFSPKTAKGT